MGDTFKRVESVEELETATLTDVETKKSGGIRAVKELLTAEKKAESSPQEVDTPSGPEVGAEDVKEELHVTVERARDLEKRGMFGKADPYLRISFGDQIVKSKTINNDLNPDWNFKTSFNIEEENKNDLLIEIFDKDTASKDDLMGKTSISPADLPKLKQAQWIPLQGVKSGELFLSAEIKSVNQGKEDSKLDSTIVDQMVETETEATQQVEIKTLTEVAEKEAEQKERGEDVKIKSEVEAKQKAADDTEKTNREEESQQKAEAAQTKLKEEAKLKADTEKAKQEEEERLKAETEKAMQEEEARLKAEAEAAKLKREEEEKLKAEAEKAKPEEEARMTAEAEAAKAKQEEEERLKAEAEKARQEEEAMLKAEAEAAKAKAEAEKARVKQEEEEKLKAEAEKAKQEGRKQEARMKAEAEAAKAIQEEEARLKAEAEAAKAKQEEEARQKAEAEKARQEEEARLKAEAE